MGLDNPLHIAFLVVILLLVFGAKRLPEIGRSLGSGMREFKQSITGESGAQQRQALGAPPQQPALETTTQPPAAQPAPAAQAAAAEQPPPAEGALAHTAAEQASAAEQKQG
jgi:sec-independent protein translocase protein TatA